jgi:hypothetical protein
MVKVTTEEREHTPNDLVEEAKNEIRLPHTESINGTREQIDNMKRIIEEIYQNLYNGDLQMTPELLGIINSLRALIKAKEEFIDEFIYRGGKKSRSNRKSRKSRKSRK